MAETNPSPLSVPQSALLAGGPTGFEGVTVKPREQLAPVEELASDFYANVGRVFGGDEAVQDPLRFLQEPVEAGHATIAQAAENMIRDGSADFTQLEAARVLTRQEIDAHFAANGGDGDQDAIDAGAKRLNLFNNLQEEFVRAQVPGWDETPERRIRANGIAEAAGQPVPFPQESAKTAQMFATPEVDSQSVAENLPAATNLEISLAPGKKMEGVDSRIEALVEDADWLSDRDREEAFKEAKRLAHYDGIRNRVITRMSDGEAYWAKEYPTVFTFDGRLRGSYEDYPDDPTNQTAAQAMSGPGDKETHVIIETDDGHAYLFRRTNDTHAAAKQTFEVTSTRLNTGHEDGKPLSRKIDTEQLKEVVIMPGHPLVLGEDPKTGKRLHTSGKVMRITAIQKSEVVHPDHPHLKQSERFRDAPARFVEAMELARKQQVGSDVGPLVVRHS